MGKRNDKSAEDQAVLPPRGEPELQHIELALLRIDHGLQMRAAISEDHIASLVEAYKAQQDVPPIRVICDSKTYWVWDGNHRVLARRRAGCDTLPCLVEPGTYRDAILRAAGANAEHKALKRTNADKRTAVLALLADKQWSLRSNRWIAKTCGVSDMLVGDIRDELAKSANDSQVQELAPERTAKEELDSVGTPATREGQDGKTYQASKPKSAPAATVDLPPELRRAVRNTEAAGDPKQMARLARLAKEDPPLAETVANMLRDCEVSTVEEALVESDQPEPEPQQEASAVLRQMLEKTKSVWRIQCPKSASPSLGAAVLEAVADEWLSGGWF